MSFVKCLMAKYLTQSTSITCRDLNDFVLTVRSLMMDLEGLGPLPPGANNRILRLYQKTSNQLSEKRTLIIRRMANLCDFVPSASAANFYVSS